MIMPILAGNSGLIGEVIQSFLKAWETKLKIKTKKGGHDFGKKPAPDGLNCFLTYLWNSKCPGKGIDFSVSSLAISVLVLAFCSFHFTLQRQTADSPLSTQPSIH